MNEDTQQSTPDARLVSDLVSVALTEDVGTGDVTADVVPNDTMAKAIVIAREPAVICGRPWFDEVFRQLDTTIDVYWDIEEGAHVQPDQLLCRLSGPAAALLTGERTALNFLQSLSATATIARCFADALRGTNCYALDTRKTVPGLRHAQKYAVAIGGAVNHRVGLYDAILIKENHIVAAGSIKTAADTARAKHPQMMIEVEVEDLNETRQALDAGADILLLDNFTLDDLSKAVALNKKEYAGRAKLEASGNITLERIRAVAATGVDYVSVGAMTKNINAVDLSMRFQEM